MSKSAVSILPCPRPRIESVGTALPAWQYQQSDLVDLLAIPHGLGRRFFAQSGIATRSFYLPSMDGQDAIEDQSALLERHRRGSLDLGRTAIERCLCPVGLTTADIDFLCCVTSSGFMLPGLSAMYIRHLGFNADCQRIDIVGMGCNAALNALNTAAAWTVANPRRYALMVCCEINSAIHVRDDRTVTSLVNSLFGDGCGALLLRSDSDASGGPEILGLTSHIVPDAWRAISYHWSSAHNKFELYLDRAIPSLLGEESPTPISALLDRFELSRTDVSHWLVHAGGKRVLSAIGEANGLSCHQLRHAYKVMRNSGNLGSTTVIFSYEELLKESIVACGDYGVMVTMGPGATVETALVRW